MKIRESLDWQAFLSDTEKTGALISVPPRKTKESWQTTLRIIQIYGRTPLTLTDMAEIYSPRLSRAAVDARFRIGIKIVYGRLPQEIQGKYPLGELLKAKPESLSKRVARSVKLNGLAGVVVERMSETRGDVAWAMQILDGVSPRQKAVVMNKMREWGLLGRSSVRESLELINRLRDPDVPIEEKRPLLAGVRHHVLQIHKRGKEPLFISVRDLAKKANLACGPSSTQMREIIDCLRGAGVLGSTSHRIGEREVHYHFTLVEDPEPLRVLAERFPEAKALILS